MLKINTPPFANPKADVWKQDKKLMIYVNLKKLLINTIVYLETSFRVISYFNDYYKSLDIYFLHYFFYILN